MSTEINQPHSTAPLAIYGNQHEGEMFVYNKDQNPFGHTPRNPVYVQRFLENLDVQLADTPDDLPTATIELVRDRLEAISHRRGYENEQSFANGPKVPVAKNIKLLVEEYNTGGSEVDDSLRILTELQLRSLELLRFTMPYGRGSKLLPIMRDIGKRAAIRFNPEAEYMLSHARIEKLEPINAVIGENGTINALAIYSRLMHGYVDAGKQISVHEKIDSVVRLDDDSPIWDGSNSNKRLRRMTQDLARQAYGKMTHEESEGDGWRIVLTENSLLSGYVRRIFEAEYEHSPEWLLEISSSTYAVNTASPQAHAS